MAFREYDVAPEAVDRGRAAGICGDVAARLRRMARRSAPFTSNYGNRRFQGFVLSVDNGTVRDVRRVDF